MAVRIVYELDCHCGAVANSITLDTTNPQDDGTIRIDVEMAATQTAFSCDECGCETFTGDLETSTDPVECPGPGCDECGMPADGCTCEDDEPVRPVEDVQAAGGVL